MWALAAFSYICFLRIIFYFSHLVFLCLLKPLVQKALVKGAICRAKSSSSVRTGSLRAQGAGCTMLEPERKCFLKSSQKRLKPAPVHRACLAQQLVLAELWTEGVKSSGSVGCSCTAYFNAYIVFPCAFLFNSTSGALTPNFLAAG